MSKPSLSRMSDGGLLQLRAGLLQYALESQQSAFEVHFRDEALLAEFPAVRRHQLKCGLHPVSLTPA
jgi:hypothetical protein